MKRGQEENMNKTDEKKNNYKIRTGDEGWNLIPTNQTV